MDTKATFTRQRHPDHPKMGEESLTMASRDGLWVYPECPCPYSGVGSRLVPVSVLADWGIPFTLEHAAATERVRLEMVAALQIYMSKL